MSPEVARYDPARDRATWDAFVATSRNGTFLFDRAYMDYHADRFRDASLVVREGGRPTALLPAERAGDVVRSHGGLSYGGLVVGDKARCAPVLCWLEGVLAHLRADGVRRLVYKTVPAIYHRLPAEEDRYALFRLGARLVRRDVLSAIPPGARGPLTKGRRHALARARRRDDVAVSPSGDWAAFWKILTERLSDRHGVAPTHALDEIRRLAAAFPDRIRLLAGRRDGALAAGAVLYETDTVVHAQYLAATAAGRECGLLDLVCEEAIAAAAAAGKWFDFGSSTEAAGRVLNEGLAAYKEAFGARTVVHDFYEIDL